MNETLFYISKKKSARLLTLGILILIVSIIAISYLINQNSLYIGYIGVAIIIAVFSAFLILKMIMRLTGKLKIGVTLNEQGIISNITPKAKEIGLIYWKEIQNISRTKVTNIDFICIKFNKPNCITNEIYISASELDITFKEIESAITNYYNNYKSE